MDAQHNPPQQPPPIAAANGHFAQQELRPPPNGTHGDNPFNAALLGLFEGGFGGDDFGGGGAPLGDGEAMTAGDADEEEFHRRIAAQLRIQNEAAEQAVAREGANAEAELASLGDASSGSGSFEDSLGDYPESLATSIRNHVWEG
jgi:hypothetical protein